MQLFGRVGASQKQLQSPQKQWQTPLRLHNRCSVQATLGLMLTVFLLGKLDLLELEAFQSSRSQYTVY